MQLGRTASSFTTRVVGCAGRNAWYGGLGRAGRRRTPGMQPMCGRKLGDAVRARGSAPRKTAELVVVMPGFTGLPRPPDEADVDRAAR